MKIAINTLSIKPNQMGGTEIFLTNLIKNLIDLDQNAEFFIIVSKNNQSAFPFNSNNLRFKLFNFDNTSQIKRVFIEQIFLPLWLRKEKIDCLIAPGSTGLIIAPCKIIIIIQSMHYYIYPDLFPLAKRLYLQYLVKYSSRKASTIISVSENNKKDIVHYTKVSPTKVDVVYYGVDFYRFNKPVEPSKLKSILEVYGIKDQYIFAPISLYKYKNYGTLLRAYCNLLKDNGSRQRLIICGVDPHKNREELQKLIMDLGLGDDVFYLDYIPHDDMKYFYKGASLTIYLSTYEAFGLPVLEAMASGCPVLCSNLSSLPEVVGDAAVLVDPYDVVDISSKMHDLLTNKSLRNEYVNRGFNRAKQFSWRNCAKGLIRIYRDVVGENI